MKTPILLLLLLLSPYVGLTAFEKATGRSMGPELKGSLGLALLFLVTGSSHFTRTEAFAAMVPPVFPGATALVYVTGVMEVALAVAFLVPRLRRPAAVAAILLLVAVFPANVYAAAQGLPVGGHAWGPVYLLIRAPLQAVFVAWAYFLVLRRPGAARSPETGEVAGPGRSGGGQGLSP